MRKSAIFLLFGLFVSSGCDVPFSPKGDYTQKVVVYSTLDATKSPQFARVYFTYNVEGFDPTQNTTDPQVRTASVVVVDEVGRRYAYKDTLMKRDTSARYSSEVVAYYTRDLIPSSGKRYSLEITIPQYGKATASVTVPEPYVIYVNGSRARSVLADSTNPCNCIEVSLFGGQGAKGHLTRFYVDYTFKKKGEQGVNLRREVPISRGGSADGSVVFVYPQPDRGTYVTFSKQLFFDIVADILRTDPSAEIDVKGVTFISYAMEPNLYNYYLIAHGFGDPFSVRLDLPDFSNIQNGLGVFGAVAVDSLSLLIR